MKKTTLFFLLLSTLCACEAVTAKRRRKAQAERIATVSSVNWINPAWKKAPQIITPVFGYRFVVSGDFNGDGQQEQLVEHFISGLTGKETNKYYNGLDDYDELVERTIQTDPVSVVVADNAKIDTLYISAGGQLLGLSYLKNEGDLNGDGGDELSYVVNWADWSNVNTWHIMTFRNNEWQELYNFPMWDWQLPQLPGMVTQFGLFGTEDKVPIEDQKINQLIEDDLKAFPGLVKKLGRNKVRVTFKNEDASEDTMTVDLGALSRKRN